MRPQEQMPFLQLVPNMVTLAGLCLGVTAIRFAMADRYELAAVLILLAAIIDGLDGLIARRLSATSAFGAELDSLSDMVCFAVAPGLIVFSFALGEAHAVGWITALVYIAAGALRLARFNVMQDSAAPPVRHFVGVPAPAGALLVMLPVFVTLAGLADLRQLPVVVTAWMAAVGLLMISRIKTLSPKGLRVPRAIVPLVFIAVILAMGMTFTRFWLLLVFADLAYLVILVLGAWRQHRESRVGAP
ncbi:CDP-diacylglycerol--serine O-phosphatidyltransferase [Paracoccus sp. p4-l81]|uniref:CDP-diacylglycerol--serine O-phosphatidyltransferase n=1 Tax=unclassified Paracoccus (in: a-proteobacteria) TaxID=2688777 RepID=UPI0035B75EFC